MANSRVNVPAISLRRAGFVRSLYDHVIPKFYDRSVDFHRRYLQPSLATVVNELNLNAGDRVISFCCGTGQEFPYIQERIGPEGEIVAIDWSDGMLERARQKIADNGWKNVTLVKGDVTDLPDKVLESAPYDAGVMTGGLSIVTEPEKALQTLLAVVKSGGRITLNDYCSYSGFKSIMTTLLLLRIGLFGITRRSLDRSRDIVETISSELSDTKVSWHMGGCYYIASGTRPPNASRSNTNLS